MITLQIVSGILLVLIFSVIFYIRFSPQFGARSKGENFKRIYNSPNFSEGKFQNLVPTTLAAPGKSMFSNGLKFMKSLPGQYPDKAIETLKFDKNAFVANNGALKFSWFGHSTIILNIDGQLVLTDPVFSKRASPMTFMGVKSFEYTNPFGVDDMPPIDVVLLSHDHYDHLDYKTITEINGKVKKFCVPLGVAAHLIHWGVPESKIVELDWNENHQVSENFKLTCTPSRHFSGRAVVDKDFTLWCSWVLKSDNHSVFFCGDSGYGEHFKKIGTEHGPFDLTMMECGQYNEGWPFIHMNPEESVNAHIDLNGKYMLPIHWGKFKLSLHSWTEPIERSGKEAEKLNVNLVKTIPGKINII